mgnify:CR=1 FL=1
MKITIDIDEESKTIVVSDGITTTEAEGIALFIAGERDYVSAYGDSEVIARAVGNAYGTAHQLGENTQMFKMFKKILSALRFVNSKITQTITGKEAVRKWGKDEILH